MLNLKRDTMKRPTLPIIGIKQGEETWVKNTENTFSKIIEDNFSNLKKAMIIKVQEVYRTPINRTRKETPP